MKHIVLECSPQERVSCVTFFTFTVRLVKLFMQYCIMLDQNFQEEPEGNPVSGQVTQGKQQEDQGNVFMAQQAPKLAYVA